MISSRKIASVCALFLLWMANSANATSVSGNFGAGGYDIINFSLGSQSVVDFTYTGGYVDPTFSLFDSSGAHLVTNDDTSSPFNLFSHLTQDLAAGSYSILVSYCCDSEQYAVINGASFADTDGYNQGWYRFGGTGTLAGMAAYLETAPSLFTAGAVGSPYSLTISDAAQIGAVPIPAAAWLFGSALLSFGGIPRKRATLAA